MNYINHTPAVLSPADTALLGPGAPDGPEHFFRQHPAYAPTPLHSLDALARALEVSSIQIKDEGQRLGLRSFKALGGMYAVARMILDEAAREFGRAFSVAELKQPSLRAFTASYTVACASAGNHGRSVAAGARLLGASAYIFVHAAVGQARRQAMEQLGATIVEVNGNYDDAVRAAAQACAAHGWHCVSDTSWAGYEQIPGHVMQGYTLIAKEALAQMARPPTHLFIQAGVGGLAGAMAGYLDQTRVIVVEPAHAACLLQSMRAGAAITIAQGPPTVMEMLECHTPSLLAWRVLRSRAAAFMDVDEREALAAVHRLAAPLPGDSALSAGASGAVGLAGLLRAAADARLRAQLGLDRDARILLINTESAPQ